MSQTSRLESLAMVRAASRVDQDAGRLIAYGSEDLPAMCGSLAVLAAHLLAALHGPDEVGSVLDHMGWCEYQDDAETGAEP